MYNNHTCVESLCHINVDDLEKQSCLESGIEMPSTSIRNICMSIRSCLGKAKAIRVAFLEVVHLLEGLRSVSPERQGPKRLHLRMAICSRNAFYVTISLRIPGH